LHNIHAAKHGRGIGRWRSTAPTTLRDPAVRPPSAVTAVVDRLLVGADLLAAWPRVVDHEHAPSLTPEIAAKLLNGVRAGAYAEVAAALAGVQRSMFRQWMRRSGEPFETLRHLVEAADAFAEHSALRMVRLSGDWRVAMAYLSRRYPERWRAAASERKPSEAMLSLLRAVGLAPPKRVPPVRFWEHSPRYAKKAQTLRDAEQRTREG
jgi:hypothetical protein